MKSYDTLLEEQDDILTQLSVLVDKMKDFGPSETQLEDLSFLSHCLKENELQIARIHDEELALERREMEMARFLALS